jgi:hypothetical protein
MKSSAFSVVNASLSMRHVHKPALSMACSLVIYQSWLLHVCHISAAVTTDTEHRFGGGK